MRRPVNGKEENEGFDHHSATITAFHAALTVICCSDADSSDSRAGLFLTEMGALFAKCRWFFPPAKQRQKERGKNSGFLFMMVILC